jgi:hypothetical protein
MTQRWTQAPDQSNWGDFGADDQRGRMNWVNEAKVLQGVAEVKVGKSFSLSLPLDFPGGNALNPSRFPPRLMSTRRGGPEGPENYLMDLADVEPNTTDVVCDDVAILATQYSTQWDSFAHVGSRFDADGDGVPEKVFYNGYRANEHIKPALDKRDDLGSQLAYRNPQATALGIDNLARHGAQGRGVLIDLHAHVGRERVVVGYDQLMRIMEADGVEVERGDMVCLYTGFADVVLEMNRNPDANVLHSTCSGLHGEDPKLLQWITDSGLSALIADNYAVEIIPRRWMEPIKKPKLPLHEHCLFKNGIHLGELWYLSELATWLRAHNRSRFLLTAPPLYLPGAVGSPVNPIATV